MHSFASLQSRTQHIGNDSCLGSAKAAGLPIPDASKIKEVKKSVAGNRLSHLQEEHDARAAQWRMERENVNLKRMEEVRGGKGEGEETPTPSADWDERLEKAMKRVAALGPPRQRTAPPRPERVRKVRAHRYRKRENNTGTTTPSVTGHVDNGMELGDHVQWGPETLYANASGSMYHASYGPDPVFAGNLDYVEHPMTFHGYQQGQPQQPQSQWTSNGGVYDDDPSAQYPALSAYEGWQQTLQRGSHYEGYENSAAWIASPTAGGSVIEGGEEWLAENGYAGYHETEPALQQQVPMQPYDPYGQMDGRWPQLPQSEASSEPPVETSMSTEAGYRPIGLTFQDTTQHSQIRAYDQRGGQPSTGEQQLAPPVGEFRMTDEETCRQVDDILASLDL
ncbi:hypothetical protein C8F01DRAFT_6098 [Mycena amicta]|nr:hypothetical protein C8F01DRAFT_6098 [Mycena amicta]